MSAIQLTGSDRWEVLTPVSTGKEEQGVVHIPNSGIVTSNGQYVLPIGSLPSQPIYVTASGNEAAANGVSGIQYQVKGDGNMFKIWQGLCLRGDVAQKLSLSLSRLSPKSKTQMGRLQDSRHRDWTMARGRSSSSKMAAREASGSVVPRRRPQTS